MRCAGVSFDQGSGICGRGWPGVCILLKWVYWTKAVGSYWGKRSSNGKDEDLKVTGMGWVWRGVDDMLNGDFMVKFRWRMKDMELGVRFLIYYFGLLQTLFCWQKQSCVPNQWREGGGTEFTFELCIEWMVLFLEMKWAVWFSKEWGADLFNVKNEQWEFICVKGTGRRRILCGFVLFPVRVVGPN